MVQLIKSKIAESYDITDDVIKNCKFTASYFKESDGSITATLDGFDIIVNTGDLDQVKNELAKELLEYAEDYFSEFQLYYNSTNRKQHFPFVLRVLLSEDLNEIKGLIYRDSYLLSND